MPGAHDVAAYLIRAQNAAGRTIDKLQLQKLLYLVLGVHYELWGVAAFREATLAYRQGPVVRGVEQTYREAVTGRDPIREPIGGHPERLPRELTESIEIVLANFGTWDGPRLESYVKAAGSPWRTARGDLSPTEDGSEPINNDEIRTWYRTHGTLRGQGGRSGNRDLLARAAAGDAEAIAAFLA